MILKWVIAVSYNRKGGRNSDGTFGKGNPGKPRGAHSNPNQAALALIDGKGATSLAKMAIWRQTASSSMEKVDPRYSDGTQNVLADRMNAEAMAMCASRVLVSANSGLVTVLPEYRLYTHRGYVSEGQGSDDE